MTTRHWVTSLQILEMTDVTLKRCHHVISVPPVFEPQRVIDLQQVVVDDGVIQILGHQHREFIVHVLLVAFPVPQPSAWFQTSSTDAKIRAYDAAQLRYYPTAG